LLTKEEIKKKLEEDPSFTLPDDATDEEWDIYLDVKNDKGGVKDTEDEEELEEFEDEEEVMDEEL
jgi:hypothetical protein